MRLAPLFALLLAAPALHAQTTPDPTPAAAYYPLHVGDQWEYRDYDPAPNPDRYPYERVTVTGQTTLAGRQYFTVVTQRFRPWYNQTWDIQRSEALLRFDAESAMVRRAYPGSANEDDLFRCRLDLPIPDDGSFVPCGGQPLQSYSVLPNAPVAIGGDLVDRSVRSQYWFYFTTRLAAGIGVVGVEGCEVSCTDTRLEYARVGSMTFGEPIRGIPAFNVAGESGATVAARLALVAAPNPTAGALRLALTLPEAQTVTAEAFDALGRRVWQTTAALSAGPQTLTVDASAWAPGVYVVRATAGTASATARVVRR